MGSIAPAEASATSRSEDAKPRRRRMVPRLTGGPKRDRHREGAGDAGSEMVPLSANSDDDWAADEVVSVDKEPLLPTEYGELDNGDSGLKGRTRAREGNFDNPAPEPLWSVAIQVFVPFLIAGFGTVGAGLVLDVIQHWQVFQKVSELFILVPALLGLKGNLEMTLASRLSTQANLGRMDTAAEQWRMATGSLALLQIQATVVGFLASIFAVVMGWIPDGEFSWQHALLLCSSSLFTASVASLVLGMVMIGVVILSRKCHINPDNVATPIAASLGDLTTLALLALVASFLYTRL
ncbi:solute carrier family 41 member 1, partial [Ixodes scapularis]